MKLPFGWKDGHVYWLHDGPDTRPVERRQKFAATNVCHPFCIEMQQHTPECLERQEMTK